MDMESQKLRQTEIDITVPEKNTLKKPSTTDSLMKKERAKALEKLAKKEEAEAQKDADNLLKLLNPSTALRTYIGAKDTSNETSIEQEQEKVNTAIVSPELVDKFFQLNFGLTKDTYDRIGENDAEEILDEIRRGIDTGEYQFIGVNAQGKENVRATFKKYIQALLFKALKAHYNPDGSISKNVKPELYGNQNLAQRISTLSAQFDTVLMKNMEKKQQKNALESKYSL